MEKKKGQISEFEVKTKKKKISSIGVILITVIIISAVYFVMSGIKIIKLNHELEEAEARMQQLLNTKEDLMAEYDNVSSEEYIERVARRDLKLVRGNELLFVMPEPAGTEKTGPVYDAADNQEKELTDEAEDGKTED